MPRRPPPSISLLRLRGGLTISTGLRGLAFSAELLETLARGMAKCLCLFVKGFERLALVSPFRLGCQERSLLSPANTLTSWALFPSVVAFLRFGLAAF